MAALGSRRRSRSGNRSRTQHRPIYPNIELAVTSSGDALTKKIDKFFRNGRPEVGLEVGTDPGLRVRKEDFPSDTEEPIAFADAAKS